MAWEHADRIPNVEQSSKTTGENNSAAGYLTVAPTAAKPRVAVHTEYSKGQEAALGKALAARAGATLVAWQHEAIPAIPAIPAIAAAFGAVPTPPAHWLGDRYDMVWTFARTATGWRFAQVPQLLLAGDSTSPIS